MRRSRTSAAGLMGRPLRWARHSVPARHEVEGHQLHRAVGLAAGGTLVEHGAGALEDERLQEEGRRDERRVGAGRRPARARAPTSMA